LQKFITYYRVSTQRQGWSGLSLEAQKEAVRSFMTGQVGAQVIAEFTEIESGRKSDRAQLASALLMARMTRGTLLMAKLSRLACDVHFLSWLEKAGIKFLAADMPFANRITIGVMALVAEEEARAISRTTAALAASAMTLTEDSARMRAACGFGHGFRASSECVCALGRRKACRWVNLATLRPADPDVLERARSAWSRKAAQHALMVLPVIQ
jgi:hypothetical protein